MQDDTDFIEYIRKELNNEQVFEDFMQYVEINKVLTDDEMLTGMLFGLGDELNKKANAVLVKWREDYLVRKMAGVVGDDK